MDGEPHGRKASLRVTKTGVTFALVVTLAFLGGLYLGAKGGEEGLRDIPFIGSDLSTTPDTTADLSDFWKAWNVLNERFVSAQATSSLPSAREKVQGAIQGLTDSYGDPYTVYLPPSEAKIFQEDILGSFSGVGMEIGVNAQGLLTVIAPLKDTPAERAGIHTGDVILAIDETTTEGMSTDEAVQLIRGPRGTAVAFHILRGAERIDISVTRDNIQVPTIDYSLDSARGVYTISLYSFTASANGLFARALSEFRNSGADKLIIDLRGNPGGYLNSAVALAGHFLPKGEVVVTEDYQGKQENAAHRSVGARGVPAGTKIVILVNQGSASASEILAGALQDHGVATLIGTNTFGKGSVQELITIDGGALKMTIARWLTPAGRSISDGGLAPDIAVERTVEDVANGRDPQRERAIEFLTTGS